METSLPFAQWEGFYVIVGTSAAALTGLQFVVMTLVAEFRPPRNQGELAAFATPTIVHFCAVLLMSAIMGAPWPDAAGASLCLGLSGLVGVVYSLRILHGMSRTSYKPVFEDWMCHGALPLVAYSTLLLASIFVARGYAAAQFAVAGTAVLLMFVGIHNSWDTVTYVTLEGAKREKSETEK